MSYNKVQKILLICYRYLVYSWEESLFRKNFQVPGFFPPDVYREFKAKELHRKIDIILFTNAKKE